MRKIGIMHPGEMGISIAASALNAGNELYWLSTGRSDQTRARANAHQLREVNTLAEFCQLCEIILSVCPPHAAEQVATTVAEAGFHGLYLDANAISPQRATRIAQILQENDIQFVDGGIIGGPAWKPGETWLFLSGESAEEIAPCFKNAPLETKIIGAEIGKASALKMCYSAYSKGTTALMGAILASANTFSIEPYLQELWNEDKPQFFEQTVNRVRRSTAKAWRFEGEMLEIADTFRQAGLPGEFHLAAAEIYSRMSSLKRLPELPEIDVVLNLLSKK